MNKIQRSCRLCLKDVRVYQIIPMIQKQIKNCFDINVAPFDGLPQGICKKCKSKLTEYYMLKTNFVEKQKTLTQKINNMTKTSPDVSVTINDETKLTDSTSEARYPKKRRRKSEEEKHETPRKKLRATLSESDSKPSNAKLTDQCSDTSGDVLNTMDGQKKVRPLLSTKSVGNNQDHNKNRPSSDNDNKNATINTNHETVISECINIDFDSDTVAAVYDTVNKNIEFWLRRPTMRNIIEACYETYLKKKYSETFSLPKNYSDVENEIIDLCCKVINKQGIDCTGLLRFMEYRNRNLICQQTFSDNSIVVSKTKKYNLNNDDSDGVWTNVISTDANPQLDGEYSGPIRECNQSDKKSHNSDIEDGTSTRCTLEKFQDSVILTKQVTGFPDTDEHNSKLLNANPVANPIQLPKASHTTHELNCSKNENEKNRPLEKTKQYCIVKVFEINISGENTDTESCMPKITSISSLSVQDTEAKGREIDNLDSSTNKISQESICMPTIKEKTISELMPEKLPGVTLAPIQLQTPGITGPAQGSNLLEPKTANSNHVILDTVKMPNTKTSSPFTYLQTLLLIRGILFWNQAPENCSHAICLIDFRGMCMMKNAPEQLYMSLQYSDSNNIYMIIKDDTQKLISMDKISAYWQWIILKLYSCYVNDIVLEKARKSGSKVYDCTKNFLCILQSITMVKTVNENKCFFRSLGEK